MLMLILAIVATAVWTLLFILWIDSCETYVREIAAHVRNDPPKDLPGLLILAGIFIPMALWWLVVFP